MRHIIVTLMIALLLLPGVGEAGRVADQAANADEHCFREKATFSLNFNGTKEKAEEIPGLLDQEVAEIRKLARQAGIDQVTLNNQSYNVSINHGQPEYQYRGSIGVEVQPVDKAASLLDLLRKQHYKASLNVNRYKDRRACKNKQ